MTEAAAVVAAIVFALLALFQVALAAGAPFGGVSWGGTHQGKLPRQMRFGSAIGVVVLVLAALIVLAAAGVIGWSPIPEGALTATVWVLAGFLVFNTLGNLASKSRFERLVFGPVTAFLVVLCVTVALTGDGPT